MLTQDRNTPWRSGSCVSVPLTAGAVIYAGGIVCINTATAFGVKGSTATGLVAVGIANEYKVGGAVNGEVSVDVRKGWLRVNNSASTDEITLADIGSTAYLVDDETVAKTNGGSTRSAAGVIKDVDVDGVWIEF